MEEVDGNFHGSRLKYQIVWKTGLYAAAVQYPLRRLLPTRDSTDENGTLQYSAPW